MLRLQHVAARAIRGRLVLRAKRAHPVLLAKRVHPVLLARQVRLDPLDLPGLQPTLERRALLSSR